MTMTTKRVIMDIHTLIINISIDTLKMETTISEILWLIIQIPVSRNTIQISNSL